MLLIRCYVLLLCFVFLKPTLVSGNPLDEIGSYLEQQTEDIRLMMLKRERVIFSFGTDAPGSVQAGELSKWMLASLILVLEENNKLNLQTKLGDVFQGVSDEMREITLFQLLTHTSGLPASSVILSNENLNTQQAARRIFRRENLIFSPGTTFYYSQAGYLLAAAMAEEITGKNTDELFITYVARPAGMVSSYFSESGQHFRPDVFYTSMGDLSAFMSAWLNYGKGRNRQVFANETLQRFFEPHTQGISVARSNIGRFPYLIERPYSFGIWVEQQEVDGKSGNRLIGFSGRELNVMLDECSELGFILYHPGSTRKSAEFTIELGNIVIGTLDRDCARGIVPSVVYRKTEEQPLVADESRQAESRNITTLQFRLERQGDVKIIFFDPLGNELFTLVNEALSAGEYTYSLEHVEPGLYFYRLETVDKNITRKIFVEQ